MKKAVLPRLAGLTATAALLCSGLTIVHAPSANAQEANGDVSGSVRNGIVNIKGRIGGGNGESLTKKRGFKTDTHYFDSECTLPNGIVSHHGSGLDFNLDPPVRVGIDPRDANGPNDPDLLCLVIAGPGPGQLVKDQAKKAVPVPVIKTNFAGDFLTGAEIKFDSNDLREFTVQLDQAQLDGNFLTVTPLEATWDFDDGTKSTDLAPTHIYESIAPDQQDKDFHKVRVTVTAKWRVVEHNAILDEVTDLGVFASTGGLDKSVVQVWSKQQADGAE
jgi:hypothetical protein